MDGILADGRKGRLWFCKRDQGHVLGIVLSTKLDDHFVDQLILFRNAVQPEFITSEAKVMGSAEGTVNDVECDLCSAKRTWWMGEAALERFMSSRAERRKKPERV